MTIFINIKLINIFNSYYIILSLLLKFKIELSNFIIELDVFSKIFFTLFFLVKYNFIIAFEYLFASSNRAMLTIIKFKKYYFKIKILFIFKEYNFPFCI